MFSILRSRGGTAAGIEAGGAAAGIEAGGAAGLDAAGAGGAVDGVATVGEFCCAVQLAAARISAQPAGKNLFNKKTAFFGPIAAISGDTLLIIAVRAQGPAFPRPAGRRPQKRLIRCAKSPTFENPAKFRL